MAMRELFWRMRRTAAMPFHAGHVEVEDGNVRVKLLNGANAGVSGRCLSHDLKLGVLLNYAAQSAPHDRVIVRN
jgi:hypothetical protein